MNNLLWPVIMHALIYGTVLSVLLSVMIVWSLWFNSEMWLHSAPRAIQAAHGPISARSKQQRTFLIIAFFAMVMGMPGLALQQLPTVTGEGYTFQTVFLTLWIVYMLFNLVDLVVIDWLVIEWWQPAFLRTTRLATLMTEPNYRFHFIGFCKGSVGITLVCLLVAGGMAL